MVLQLLLCLVICLVSSANCKRFCNRHVDRDKSVPFSNGDQGCAHDTRSSLLLAAYAFFMVQQKERYAQMLHRVLRKTPESTRGLLSPPSSWASYLLHTKASVQKVFELGTTQGGTGKAVQI